MIWRTPCGDQIAYGQAQFQFQALDFASRHQRASASFRSAPASSTARATLHRRPEAELMRTQVIKSNYWLIRKITDAARESPVPFMKLDVRADQYRLALKIQVY